MDRNKLYSDIARRTQGDIYIGVVGPVRTGKSTFIKRFTELIVLPNIDDVHVRTRVSDELPQSASGRAVMTTQPKFVPSEAVRIELDDNRFCSVRLVDCVGYLVPDATGHLEDGAPRMVRTPWFDEAIPFEDAAELGTHKVMLEHSTVGVVMTTDASFLDIPRDNYREAETRVIAEMRQTGKPFVVVVNSADPDGAAAQALKAELEAEAGVCVVCMNVLTATAEAFTKLIEQLLLEFPLRLIELKLPSFLMALNASHPLMQRVMLPVLSTLPKLKRLRDCQALTEALSAVERFLPARTESVSLGEGTARIELPPEESLFYEVLSEQCGCEIKNERTLMETLTQFVSAKSEYDRVSDALASARQTGYGTVAPDINDMQLEEPEIVRQGNRFGVRLCARASGMHIIRVDVDSEVNPVVGTEEQSEALVSYINDTFSTDPQAIWQTNIFGKPLYDLVREGMEHKSNNLPAEVRERMQLTLQRVVNEGCNGLICIML